MGLVNRVVPLADLEAEGIAWAAEILQMSPTAIRFLKSRLPRRHRRPRRAPGVRRRGDGPLLHHRRGPRGIPRLPGEAPARLHEVPAPPVSEARAVGIRSTVAPRGRGCWPSGPPPCRRRPRASWWASERPLPSGRPSGSTRRSAASPSPSSSRSLANLANDLSDFRRGADTPDRAGPTRVAAAGLVSERRAGGRDRARDRARRARRAVARDGGRPLLLVVGILAVAAALAYTGGPFPYGYRALGEAFVFLFFGLVAVVGTAYLQALRLNPLFFVAAKPGRAGRSPSSRRSTPACSRSSAS